MLKKVISYLLVFTLSISLFIFTASAEEPEINVKAKAAVLMDVASGKVLYALNEHERLYPASVTKIMAMLLFAEAIDGGRMTLSEKVTASETAAGKGGSQIWLKEGEQMTVDELLRATAIGSANDACTALGEHLAGSEEGFVKMMNDRAKALGMNDTHFDNCSGLDDDTQTHLTSAYDIGVMSCELLKHEFIRNYTTVWMDSLRGGETELVNTNKLVRFYKGTTGLKTGTTSKAGHCLSASAERDGLHLAAVVLGAENSNDRFEGAKALLNYGFASYERVTPDIDETLIGKVGVIRGLTKEVTPVVSGLTPVTLRMGQKDNTVTETELCENVEAPVEKGQLLGRVIIKSGEEVLCEYPLVSENEIRRISFADVLARFFVSLVKNDKESNVCG